MRWRTARRPTRSRSPTHRSPANGATGTIAPTAATERAGPAIGHVQFADAPGRHEPGTGGIDFSAALHALKKIGYDDALAAEYRPAGQTEDGLTWMADFERMMA